MGDGLCKRKVKNDNDLIKNNNNSIKKQQLTNHRNRAISIVGSVFLKFAPKAQV